SILGENLIGLQAGNEPDFYGTFGKRPANYTQFDYFGDIGQLVNQMGNDPLVLNRTMLLAPSVATGPWTPEQVWDTGFLNSYAQYMSWLAVEHYPIDNCFAQFHTGIYHDPQQQLYNYLMHNYTTSLIAPYLNSTNIAQQANKPFSCLKPTSRLVVVSVLAYSNFSMALFHVGGQNVFYNPFTSPPSNQSSYHQWTIGPIYYSALAMAETISNGSQVLDITNSSNLNNNAPAYVIYENGHPVRLALFNMVSDPSGASDIQFTFSIGGSNVNQNNATPAQVKVKYLLASVVTQKGNFTWAGLASLILLTSINIFPTIAYL
ncbi:glycoside hydrolase family 79 protein, partial [Amanita muscaria Koide BX008]